MTRKAFLQKYFVRFAVSLTLVGLIVYTVFHVFSSTSGSLITTPARRITDVQLVSGEAYLFRDETVLTVSTEGLVNDVAESGEKVSKGVTLTEVWSSPSATLTSDQNELDDLNRLIAVLENSKVGADSTLAQAEAFRADARLDYRTIRESVTSGDFTELQVLEDDLLTLLNRYATLIDSSDGIDDTLSKLKAQRAVLLSGTRTLVTNTKASGYFYDRTYVDGYESIFTLSALEKLTADDFPTLTASEPQETESGFAVGKMAYGYAWYLAVAFDASAAELFEEGVTYGFTFPENRDYELNMSCTKRLVGSDGGVVAVFTSNEVPTSFTFLRAQNVEITVGKCTGYYVPESALHCVNGVDGVYIFQDSAVYFRRIEILYRGDGYCIVAEQGDRGSDYLALYDVLVTSSGKELYDGRVFQ